MRYTLLIIVSVVTMLFLGALPLIIGWNAYDPTTKVFKLGEYSSWLQGILTPGVFVIALFSLKATFDAQVSANQAQREANEAQRETNEAQRDANRRLLMGIMLQNIERFQGHLNYTASASVYNARRNRDNIEQGRMYYINLLHSKKGEPCIPGQHTDDLKNDLRSIVLLAKESGTLSFLDRRIVELDVMLNGPTP